jgi:hypothetical protein
MSAAVPVSTRSSAFFTGLIVAALALLVPRDSRPEACVLQSQHVGLTFPVEKMEREWACRLEPIISQYTTAHKIGPVKTALAEAVYLYLLDHPPTAAALINRLDLGLYKSELRGPGRYWGSDGEGTEGIVQRVYHDDRSRIYFLEGSHHSRALPNIRGKAVVFLRMTPVTDLQGDEAVETTLVSYVRLDNRFLSGLLSLLRPLIGNTVTRKLLKGVEAVNRLGIEMRQHPERVLFEAMDPPALPAEDVAFLKRTLAGRQEPGKVKSQSVAPR